MLRSKKILPLAPAHTPAAERVLRSLDFAANQLDVNPEEVVLVGSAALALYGVTLHPEESYSLSPSERPHDIDMTSTTAEMQRHFDKGTFRQDPMNLPEGKQTVIRSLEGKPLPIELISRIERTTLPPPAYDHQFQEHWKKHAVPIVGSPFRIATSKKIADELIRNKTYNAKYTTDYTHLRNSNV